MRVAKVVGWGLVAAVAAWSMPSAATAVVSLSVSDASGQAGATVKITVSINASEGEAIGSFSNQLNFPTETRITTTAINPSCRALIGVTLAQFRYRPQACSGLECTGVLAAILGEETGVPPGDVYECDVAIAADAEAGDYEITVSDAAYANPAGMEFPITGAAGVVSVVTEPTATPTHTHTPIPPATNTPVPTNTLAPTSTRTVTPTFAPGGDDGCQMGSGDSSNALLALLLPIAGVLVLRRRSQYRV